MRPIDNFARTLVIVRNCNIVLQVRLRIKAKALACAGVIVGSEAFRVREEVTSEEVRCRVGDILATWLPFAGGVRWTASWSMVSIA